MQAVDIIRTGAIIIVPGIIDDYITKLVLVRFPPPIYTQLYIRGVVSTLSSIVIMYYCKGGIWTFPYFLMGLYWQYHGFKEIEYVTSLQKSLENLEVWIQRLKYLDKHSKALKNAEFSNTIHRASLWELRKEIDRLLFDKIHNQEKLVDLISELNTKIINIEHIMQGGTCILLE